VTDGNGPDSPRPASLEAPDSSGPATDTAATRRVTPFAHASEAEMARILDFYAVTWEYEPHTFPILWNLDGDVVESFAPDFYLPDLDIYLEMTTLKQRLVRKKNRKLRRLRELYPDLRIKLFYARDFRALMLKYGKFALVGELSGTPGQVMPERAQRATAPVSVPTTPVQVPAPVSVVIEPAAAVPPARATPLPPTASRSRASRRRRAAAARRAAVSVAESASVSAVHAGDAA
jgi:hypothetical protein